jgi:hypothetical protein
MVNTIRTACGHWPYDYCGRKDRNFHPTGQWLLDLFPFPEPSTVTIGLMGLALLAGFHRSGWSKKVCQHLSTGVLEWHDNEGSPLVFHHARLKPPAFTTAVACFYTH